MLDVLNVTSTLLELMKLIHYNNEFPLIPAPTTALVAPGTKEFLFYFIMLMLINLYFLLHHRVLDLVENGERDDNLAC